MAQKSIVSKVQKEEYKHQFYCDNCGKFLGESIESDDGYYAEFGEYDAKAFIDHTWFKLQKELCDNCKEELNNTIIKTLKKIGFEED